MKNPIDLDSRTQPANVSCNDIVSGENMARVTLDKSTGPRNLFSLDFTFCGFVA